MTDYHFPLAAFTMAAAIAVGVSAGVLAVAVEPLQNAHAHNDYWHERPLVAALEHGFTSVEADVFLEGCRLLVGHEKGELNSSKTLEALYLDPLARRVRENRGSVYQAGQRFFLFIDIKSDADSTYAHLKKVLQKYADMLTIVESGNLRHGAVTVVISGARPRIDAAETGPRYVGLDGRLSDLDSRLPAHVMPIISDHWPSHFDWKGDGPMLAKERAKLREIVRKSHAAGRVVRFWATPENESVWRELRSAGVDLIGTDQLGRLADFLLRAQAGSERSTHRVELPERQPIELRFIAKLGPGPVQENSGIVKSRQYADVFWMHNDSGDEPRIYPVNRRGINYPNSRYPNEHGVLVGGAINVDWEDIAVDDDGHVIIADLGNNDNDRRDLVLYYLLEPAATAGRTTFLKKVFVCYPDQQTFPAAADEFNFDCEAVFTVGNTVFLLSKNRSNTCTNLYRLDEANPNVTNVLTLIDTFELYGQAVGADCTADGKRLAVLTYTGVWLFERTSLDQSFFTQRVRWAPFPERDAEAICFADEKTLLVADESLGEIYEVRIRDLTSLR